MSSAQTMPTMSSSSKLNAAQQQHLIQLLQACIKCIHSGVFHPVVYQAMGALHQYSMMNLPQGSGASIAGASKPAFFLVKNHNDKSMEDASSEDKKVEAEDTRTGLKNDDDEDEDVLCYGWMQQLAGNRVHDGDEQHARQIDDHPRWNSVLALLVQKDKNDEPCLWVTREVMRSSTASPKNIPGTNKKKWQPPTELETLHQIPILRRLQSCRYHNFYGDHRIILRMKHKRSDIVLKCPTAQDAQQWVQQLQWRKQQAMGDANNIELEMVDTADSQDDSDSGLLKHRHVNIVNEQMQSTSSLPESPEKGIQKRLAVQLEQAEDLKRAQKEAQELEERERQLKEQEEQIKHETALRTDLTRVEREQEARRRGEEARRKKELEYEQEKLEREKKRREELERQRKLAREEQRKKDEEKKKKFLEHEEKKERLKAQAAAEAAAKLAKIPKSTSIKPTSPPTAAKPKVPAKPSTVTVRSATENTQGSGGSSKAASTTSSPKTTKATGNEGLWFSLDQQMSAFEAADAERRKVEEAKRKEQEEQRKIKLGLDETNDDPEEARRRIAEQARQRLVQEEAGRRKPETPVKASPIQQEQARQVTSPVQQTQYVQQQAPAHQRSHSNPTPNQQQHQHYQYPPQQHQNNQQRAQWQRQQQQDHHAQRHTSHQQAAHPHTHHNAPRTPQQPPRYNAQPSQNAHPHQYPQHQQQYNQQQGQQHPAHTSQSSPAYQQRQAPQQQQQNAHRGYSPQPTHHNQQQQQQQMPSHEPPVDSSGKYAAMANQSDDGHAATTRIKHAILVQWALLPPRLHIVRPIDVLLTTVHQVFPPALGVQGHEYFSKWKPVSPSDVASEEKLKKAVRKLRFFLHPDKLPRDFSDEQLFTCKLLWDVTNDAFEDYKKGKEDLDWV